jgi:eukaryotic-like serine/threonine-protein kinase
MNRWLHHALVRQAKSDTTPSDAIEAVCRPTSETFFKDAVAQWNCAEPCSIEVPQSSLSLPAFLTIGDPAADNSTTLPPQFERARTVGRRMQPPNVGEELAGFLILALLGRGAEGRVYLATQTELANRPVVLKVNPRRGGEHQALARLQHTHIVPILFSLEVPERGLRILCFPYMGGTSFEHVLKKLAVRRPSERSGLDILEILDRVASPSKVLLPAAGPARDFLMTASYDRAITWIGLCLAEALHHAHLRNLVHSDVKPSNILLAADGMPLLLDFHLARTPFPVRRDQQIGGTIPYIAPEQFAAMTEGRAPSTIDARADIYALAMVMHIALANRRPVSESRIAIRLRLANHRISPGLAAIIARALAKQPEQRYPSAAVLAEDLRRHLSDQPLVGVANQCPVERWAKWRRQHPHTLARVWAISTAFVGLTFAGLTDWFAANRRVNDAIGELEQGRLHVAAAEYHQAALSFQHGVDLLDSGTRFDRLLPHARETRKQLIAAKVRNWRAELGTQLHDLAERVRILYAAETTPRDTAQKLQNRLAEIWRAHQEIDRQLAQDADEATRSRLRADLLDLVIIWAELRVGIADDAMRPEAHREALQIFAEAEVAWGPSPVLSLERRRHAAAIGQTIEPERGGARRELTTAWECYAMGRALMRVGDLEQASKALDRAVLLHPRSLWAHFYRGQCALLRDRYVEAVDAFGACIALSPEAVCYYNRSLAYAGLNAIHLAQRDFERAHQLDASIAAWPPHPHDAREKRAPAHKAGRTR